MLNLKAGRTERGSSS